MSEISRLLYDFLPGSAFGPTYTFADAAKDSNVAAFWIKGSKLPAIQQLLELTYIQRHACFPDLIINIVKGSIKYRQKSTPLTRKEVVSLISLLQQIGIAIPSLSRKDFLESLPSDSISESVKQYVDPIQLSKIFTAYSNLFTNPDHQSRGYELQDVVEKVMSLYELNPKKPFRVTGEEIDGSFVLDNEIYLLEARWRKDKATHSDLIAFSSKVQAKAEWSRGLFLSVEGFHSTATESVMRGRRPNFIIMSGSEFELCLKGEKNLISLLREKVRAAAEGTLN